MTRNQFIHHVVVAYAHNFTLFQSWDKDTHLAMIEYAKELADKVAKEAPFDSKIDYGKTKNGARIRTGAAQDD